MTMFERVVKFSIEKLIQHPPQIWAACTDQKVPVWSVMINESFKADCLEPFTANDRTLILWGLNRSHGLCPTVNVGRYKDKVVWSLFVGGGRRRYPKESECRVWIIDGNTYNVSIGEGDFQKLPSISPLHLKWILGELDLPIRQKVLYQQSIFKDEAMFSFVSTLRDWYFKEIIDYETGSYKYSDENSLGICVCERSVPLTEVLVGFGNSNTKELIFTICLDEDKYCIRFDGHYCMPFPIYSDKLSTALSLLCIQI